MRDIYALDLAGWLFSFGRRPIKRHLPNQRFVLMVKHMHGAVARLPACRIAPEERHSLARLERHAVAGSEEQLRQRLRPLVHATLDEVRLQPHNFPERVARNKLTEELLDLVCERGFVTVGDLRDVVSRNNLKLADLSGADEFFLGDPLIRANRKLSVALDGIYRRGEIYLRWLQRLSSLAFGTRPGRFLMRYLVLPYGIAYVALEGTLHLLHMVQRWSGQPRTHLLPVATLVTVAVLGTFLLAVMHAPWFRRQVLGMLRQLAGIVRLLCLDLPAAFFRLPVVQRILDSKPFAVIANVFLKPAVITAALALIYPLYGVRPRTAWISSAVLFGFFSLLLNTRFGRTVEEAVTDAAVRTWMRLRLSIFPALFAFTMAIFRGLGSVISVKFKGTHLEDAIEYLQTYLGQPIVLDPLAMEELGLKYDTPVTLSLNRVTLRTVLTKVVRDLGLAYVIKDEVIQVTTPKKAQEMMVTHVYSIADLARDPLEAAILIDLIQSTVDPGSWKANGGAGTIAYHPLTQSPLIKQSSEFHAAMSNTLP